MGGGGGGDKKETTTTYKAAPWIKAPAERTLNKAEQIGNQDWRQYEGDRLAEFGDAHQTAFDIGSKTGEHEAGIAEAGDYMRKGGESFLDADISEYMNPYTQNVIDPVVRELNEGYLQKSNQQKAAEVSTGAFGGNRSQINQEELFKAKQEAVSDATAKGHHQAFNNAAALFQADRDSAARTGGQLASLTSLTSQLSAQDFDKALLTGEIQKEQEQRGLDISYMDFVEERNWDYGGKLGPMISALQAMPKEGTSNSESEGGEGGGGSMFSQIAGAAITIGAAYFTGGSSLAYINPATLGAVSGGSVGSPQGGGASGGSQGYSGGYTAA